MLLACPALRSGARQGVICEGRRKGMVRLRGGRRITTLLAGGWGSRGGVWGDVKILTLEKKTRRTRCKRGFVKNQEGGGGGGFRGTTFVLCSNDKDSVIESVCSQGGGAALQL